MEVAAPPATSVPASGSPSAAAARSSEAAAPPSAAAAVHRVRNDAAAKNRAGWRCTRRRVDKEDTVAGAAGEVTPTAAMGSGGGTAQEIRQVGIEIEVFFFFGLLFSTL